MAELERLARRIETATDLQSVVRTMKTLSAVGITQYNEAARAISGYLDTVERGLQAVLRARPDLARSGPPAPGAAALVVVGSDFGLCGPFNEEAVAHARNSLSEGIGRSGLSLLLAGHRLDQLWPDDLPRADTRIELPSSVGRLGAAVGDILSRLDRWQSERGVTNIHLVHQALGPDGRRSPRLVRVAPLMGTDLAALARREWPTRCLPMVQGPAEPVFRQLVRQMIFTRVYAACALSRAAEYDARLEAMRAADRNIGEKLTAFTREYRFRRQEAITTELLDVIAGFEAAGTGG